MSIFGKWLGKSGKKKAADADNKGKDEKPQAKEADLTAEAALGSAEAQEAETSPEPAPEASAAQAEAHGASSVKSAGTDNACRESGAAEELVSGNEAGAGSGSGSEPGIGKQEEASAPSEPKASGLKGMWNAAKKLALTPVDPWFEKMADGLSKTRQHLVGQVADMLRLHKKIDEDLWDDLEGVLLTSDVGVAATDRIMEELRASVKAKRLSEPADLLAELRGIVSRIIEGDPEHPVRRSMNIEKGRVNVILLVGVNGAGKTTTAGKLASYYKGQGMKVMLAAADTFRAAAIDQLQVWADRVGIDMIRHQEGSDPAAVVYDAVTAAKARGIDILIADTAGRLHNKANLMEELRKIRRVAGRDLEGAPHEVILVLDAAAGQNALEQAKVFNEVTELTGLVLCKLDGTGRGGIIAAISQELKIPVKFIGVGEGIDDMREFVPSQFLDALFEGKGDTGKEQAGE